MKEQKKNLEKRLIDSEAQYRHIFEQSGNILIVIEPDSGRVVAFNDNAHLYLGYTRKEFTDLKVLDFNDKSDEGLIRELESLRIQGNRTFMAKHRTKEGKSRDVQIESKVIALNDKGYLLWNCRDVTDHILSERFKHLSASIFDATQEAILVTDTDGHIILVNPAFTRITGYTPEEVLGKNPKILQSGRHDPAFYKAMWESIQQTGHWRGEIWNRRKSGETYPEWLSIMAVKDGQGHVVQYTALFSDITHRKEGEMALKLQAYYDPLTDLPNRILFSERFSQAIKQVRRDRQKAALLFVDLDRFKEVNDTFGHATGDIILKMAAVRLNSCVRETDTVARTGGDEFIIVLTNIKGGQEASIVSEEILKKISNIFEIDGHHISIGSSIGITIVPDDGEDGADLIQKADMAMYKSKSSGRNCYHFYSEKMEN